MLDKDISHATSIRGAAKVLRELIAAAKKDGLLIELHEDFPDFIVSDHSGPVDRVITIRRNF